MSLAWRWPNKIISSGSLGVMGSGVPYAVGAQIAKKTQELFVLTEMEVLT